jgi:hypothetical protein
MSDEELIARCHAAILHFLTHQDRSDHDLIGDLIVLFEKSGRPFFESVELVEAENDNEVDDA